MKRVVVTGLGIISSIGNNVESVLSSLQNLKSGIVFSKEMKNFGLKSHVCGLIHLEKYDIKRNILRFMNVSAIYAYLSMEQAIIDANLKSSIYQKNYNVGLIVGSGYNFFHKKNDKNLKLLNLYNSIKTMGSNISACLSVAYNIFGVSYSISCACATSSVCIGQATQLIQFGKQDIIFAGGSEELNCNISYGFDIMNLLSSKYNNIPMQSSRAYDTKRDGFVISGGSGILVLEELDHALSRNAKIYAEIQGYGISSDGLNMIKPSGIGSMKSMKLAMNNINILDIDYINTHATSTVIGDIIELKAIKNVFRNYKIPYISSTKSLTGHALGASGVHEIIYIILMMKYNFIVPSINIELLDNLAKNMNIVRYKKYHNIFIAMSNNFGFGGANVSIIIKNMMYSKYDI